MRGKSWLLSVAALMGGGNASEAVAAEYTPEIKTEVRETFLKDRETTDNVFTDFTAVQAAQNSAATTTADRNSTAAELQSTSMNAWKILNDITPKANITFLNTEVKRSYENQGNYSPQQNLIRTHVDNVQEGQTIDQNQLSVNEMGILAHEHHHQYFAHTKIETTSSGITLASQAPMSLEQSYKLTQANEIGSNIATCIALRQVYIEETLAANQAKKDLAEQLSTSKDLKPLKEAVENNKSITINNDKIKFVNNKNKPVEISLNKLNDETGKILRSYVTHTNRTKEVLSVGDKDNSGKYKNTVLGDVAGEYFAKIKSGEINPLNAGGFDKEMEQIGTICAKNWQEMRAYGLNGYDRECFNIAAEFFESHNYQDIKPNSKNYEKAVMAATTIGGYDFSKYVKSELTCKNMQIKEADKMIENGHIKMDVAYNGLNLSYDVKNINDHIAFGKIKNQKVGNLPDIMPQKVIWTAKNATDYKKFISDIQKNYPIYTKEQAQAIENRIKDLNIDSKEAGSQLTEAELKKFTRLCNTLQECNKQVESDDNSLSTSEFYLRNLYEAKQKQSIHPNTIKAWEDIHAKLRKTDFSQDYFNPVQIKERIVEELEGKEYGKTADQFKVKEDVAERYQDKVSYATIPDLSQPFLVDLSHKQKANEAMERIKARQQKIYQTMDSDMAKQQTAAKQTPQSTLIASTYNGR